jgi:hypothetical protein
MLARVKLLTLHRILVTTAILFSAFFVWKQVGIWRDSGSSRALCVAGGFVVVALLLTWYLTNLKRFVRIESSKPGEER